MKVTIVHFSQTGNTRQVAEAMEQSFVSAGFEARSLPIRGARTEDLLDADVIGVGTPSFLSRAPTPIREFLRSQPELSPRRGFVFATAGHAPGRVLSDMTKMLQKRGVHVAGGFMGRGEVHHPAPVLRGRLPGRPNAADLADAANFASALAEHLRSGREGLVEGSRPDTLKAGFGFYNMVGAIGADWFMRLSVPKPKLDTEKCSSCGWCAEECPVGNISMDPYPVLSGQCIRCYRCLNGCPEEAFSANWKWGNIAPWMLYNETFDRWFGEVRSEKASAG